MRAFVLTGYGAITDNVRLAQLPDPVAGSGEVLVEIHAASLNPIDFKIVLGDLKRVSKYKLPRPFGFDASGVVKVVGPGLATITVTGGGASDSAPIHVATAALSVEPNRIELLTGETSQLSAGNAIGPVTWETSDAAVATVSSTGLYTAPGSVPSPNTVTVSATSAADPTASANATVTITKR